MSVLILEVADPTKAARWRVVRALQESYPGGGSFSNNASGRREVIHFYCYKGYATIERSLGGVDTEIGDKRLTATTGFERIATLEKREIYELDIQTDAMLKPQRFRFRFEAS
jgi:hypothetical protein